jgi:hypothetical protein
MTSTFTTATDYCLFTIFKNNPGATIKLSKFMHQLKTIDYGNENSSHLPFVACFSGQGM